MKKKRADKKKAGNISNKGTNNEITAAAIPKDKHHNYSNPCTNLSAQIYNELFPSISSAEDDNGDTSLSKGKLLFTQQPLLAFMILRYMIEERKKIRAADLEKVCIRPSTTDTTEITDVNNDADITSAVEKDGIENTIDSSRTKKKKKKRKKKKATNNSTTTAVVETSHNTVPNLYDIGTNLDTLIDWYIDSEEASNIIDNEAVKWGKRDMDSFVTFLRDKFNGEEVLNWNVVLPTISIGKVNDMLSSAECSSCKASSTSHLINLLANESKESNTSLSFMEKVHAACDLKLTLSCRHGELSLSCRHGDNNDEVSKESASRSTDNTLDIKEFTPNETLFVANLNEEVTTYEDLQLLYEPFGELVRIDIKRNYAFVQFSSVDAAICAQEGTNGGRLDDSEITVEFAARRGDDRGKFYRLGVIIIGLANTH